MAPRHHAGRLEHAVKQATMGTALTVAALLAAGSAWAEPEPTPGRVFMQIYGKTLSQIDGDRCPSHPNCLHYAGQAVAQHGGLLGIGLTVDRLIHEADQRFRGPFVETSAGVRIDDPLRSNDFWLKQ